MASALLGAASLSSAQQQTLVTAATSATGTPQEFWASLPSQPGFDTATVEHLQLTLQLGLLTGSNVSLVQALLAQPSVSSVKDLVSMDGTAWTQLLSTPSGGQPIPVPAGIPGATPAEQLQNYAQYLRSTVQSIFPNETVAHLVATGAISTEPDTQAGDRAVLHQLAGLRHPHHADHQLPRSQRLDRVRRHPRRHPAGGDQPTAADAAGVPDQRRLRHHDDAACARARRCAPGRGHPPAELLRPLRAPRSAGPRTAEAICQRAAYINARNLGLIVQLNDAVNGVSAPGLTGGAVRQRRLHPPRSRSSSSIPTTPSCSARWTRAGARSARR